MQENRRNRIELAYEARVHWCGADKHLFSNQATSKSAVNENEFYQLVYQLVFGFENIQTANRPSLR